MSKVESDQIGAQSVAFRLLQPLVTIPKMSFDPAQYEGLVKRLSKLSEEASFTDSSVAYTEFGEKVYVQLNMDRESAKDGLKI